MEAVDNLELLKEGDYVRITKKNSYNPNKKHILEVKEQKNKEIICRVVAEIDVNNEEEILTFWSEDIAGFGLKKDIRYPKKKKLKHKKYSYNSNYSIFKLNKNEVDKMIKEAILRKL